MEFSGVSLDFGNLQHQSVVESEKIESPNIEQTTIPLSVVDGFFLALKIKIKSI